ncbi:MAG: response regulator transcription factor [Chloroflexota bacterium]
MPHRIEGSAALQVVASSRAGALGVLVIDAQPLYRAGLKSLLAGVSDAITLVGEASDGVEGLRLALRYDPAVILLGTSSGGPQGLQVIRDLKRQVPSAAIVVLAAAAEDDSLFAAVTFGASAYLVKTATSDEVLGTVGRVARGEYPINDSVLATPLLAARVLTSFRNLASSAEEIQPLLLPLSGREVEVLEWVARGNSNKEVARALAISDQTVKNHVTSIIRKLAVNDRTHAVVYALRKGWITA